MRTPAPPRDAHRSRARGRHSGEVQALRWEISRVKSAETLKKSFDERLTDSTECAIIRPSKGDDSKGTGERERAGRGGSQSQKSKRLGAATEAWRVAEPHKGGCPWSTGSREGRERDPEIAGTAEGGRADPVRNGAMCETHESQ